MSHRSRVCAVLFDTESAAYSATVAFWAGALGRAVPTKQRDRYTTLTGPLDYTVQSVEPADHGVHPFCVVPVQSNTWPEGAVTWPSG